MALPSTKPLQDGALDGVSQASSMEWQGCWPCPRARWVGLSSLGWAEALKGERSGQEQTAGLGDGLDARPQNQGPFYLWR